MRPWRDKNRCVATRIVALALLAFSGCTSSNNSSSPPTDEEGFLGYSGTGSARAPACANCHVSQSSRWSGTAHAHAWATLQNSGHAQNSCAGCHTVSSMGNWTSGSVGWDATQDARYEDVQCESCHGPGQEHVNVPDGGTKPLASIRIIADSTSTRFGETTYINCGECHQGNHHPFVEEWSMSRHANVRTSSTSDCGDCHSAQGAFAVWGVDASYVEQNDPLDEHVGIVCAVCHDPHENEHEGQLRFPIDSPSPLVNLCIKCHHKRAAPETEADRLRYTHSPEGPLLLGAAGWWPPGFGKGPIHTTHGPMGNEKMCATCHVRRTTVTDAETGAFLIQSTGHLFQAIPCLDSEGIPIPDRSCDVAEKDFTACVDCHGSESIARQAYVDRLNRVALQVAEIDSLMQFVPAGELDPQDGTFTVADGVDWNARLAEKTGSPIHNPRLIEQLMVASKQVLIDTYGL